MKKFISIFSICLFLLLNINTTNAVADSKILTQGIHNLRDTNLLTGVIYNIQNTSPTNKSLVLIIDSNQSIQELLRLEPDSPKYTLKPLQSDYLIVIIGASNLVLS